MKKTKMILSLLLVLVMVFSMAACGTPSAESSATTDSSKSEESKTEESKTEETAATAETFKVATVRWTDSWPVDFLKTGVMADLEKSTTSISTGRFSIIQIGQSKNLCFSLPAIYRTHSSVLSHLRIPTLPRMKATL